MARCLSNLGWARLGFAHLWSMIKSEVRVPSLPFLSPWPILAHRHPPEAYLFQRRRSAGRETLAWAVL